MDHSSNQTNGHPPFEEMPNRQSGRRVQLPRNISLNIPNNTTPAHSNRPIGSATNANIPPMAHQVPSMSAVPSSRFPAQSLEARGNPQLCNHHAAFLEQQQLFRTRIYNNPTISGFLGTTNNLASPPTQQLSSAQQPSNINAGGFQNNPNQGHLGGQRYFGGPPGIPPAIGQNHTECIQQVEQLQTRVLAVRTENEALKKQLQAMEENRRRFFDQYNYRVQHLTRENDSLKEANREKSEFWTQTLERSRELRVKNRELMDAGTQWTSLVQNINTSLKNSLSKFGVNVEPFAAPGTTSDGQKELLELNQMALQLEKVAQNNELLHKLVPQSNGNQASASKNLQVANPNAHAGGILLPFANEEDQVCKFFGINLSQKPAIASTSKQAAKRALADQNQQSGFRDMPTLVPQARVTISGGSRLDQRDQEKETVEDSDSDNCLVIDEGGDLQSAGQSIDENGQENEKEENDELPFKRRKPNDETLLLPAVTESLGEIPIGSEISLNDERNTAIMQADGQQVAGSNGNSNILELDCEIAKAGLFDYALCSCGREVAFLDPEFSKVEPHNHYDPANPTDILKCRFCSKIFRDKSLYRTHFKVEHRVMFFKLKNLT